MWTSASPDIVRAVALYGTFALVALALYLRRDEPQRIGLAVTCTIVIFGPLLALNQLALETGWWTFADVPGQFYDMPVDLWLTWSLLWGVGVATVTPTPRTNGASWLATIGVVAVFFAADLVIMPLYDPTVSLGASWLAGEAVAVLTILVPAALLARWTLRDENVIARGLVQSAGFAFAMLYALPMAVFDVTGEDWSTLLDRSLIWWVIVGLLTAPFGLLAFAGVWEFWTKGDGTPVPFDPPKTMVVTGPYAYVANPMQLGMTGVLIGLGVVAGSWPLAATAVGAAAFSVGYAAAVEHEELVERYGQDWLDYRREVRIFRVRRTAYRPNPINVVDLSDQVHEALAHERSIEQTSHHAAGYQPG